MILQEIFFIQFWWVFFAFESFQWELSVSCQQIFSISYCRAGWNSISNNIENFYFHLILIGFSPNDPYEKFSNSDSFEYNTSQNDHLSSNITVSSTYCVQHYTQSSTLLRPAHYCVQQNTVSTLTQRFICSPFTCQHAAVVSCWACEAPEFCVCFWVGYGKHGLAQLVNNGSWFPTW